MNKTFFNYASNIASKDMVEAMSLPKGIGPFVGFAGFYLDDPDRPSRITIVPYPHYNNSEYIRNSPNALYCRDRVINRQVLFSGVEGGLGNINHGCITKDGYVFISTDSEIVIPIEGEEYSDHIVVVAVHTPIEEEVDNPVEFRAFFTDVNYNSEFIDLYLKSVDPFEDYLRTGDVVGVDPLLNYDQDLNYYNLMELIYNAMDSNVYNQQTMTVIGVYGRINRDGYTNQWFSIVPYEGQFPNPLSFNTAQVGLIQTQMRNIESVLKRPNDFPKYPVWSGNILDWVIRYVSSKISGGITPTPSSSLPKGSVIMWYGRENDIPSGWELCDGGRSDSLGGNRPDLRGRVPVGYDPEHIDPSKELGSLIGNDTTEIHVENMPLHSHVYTDDVYAKGKFEHNFPTQYGSVIVGGASASGSGSGTRYNTSSTGGNTPISVVQKSTVINFIIKVTDDEI